MVTPFAGGLNGWGLVRVKLPGLGDFKRRLAPQALWHMPQVVWHVSCMADRLHYTGQKLCGRQLHDVQANLNGTSHRLYGRQGVWQRGCVEDKLPDRKATQVMWQTSCVADRLHGTGHRPFGRLSKGCVTDR